MRSSRRAKTRLSSKAITTSPSNCCGANAFGQVTRRRGARGRARIGSKTRLILPIRDDSEPEEAEEVIPGLVGDDEDSPIPPPFSLTAPEFEEKVPTPEPTPATPPSPRTKKRQLREQNARSCERWSTRLGSGTRQ